MLARLQKAIVFTWLAAAAGWAAFFTVRGRPGWAIGGAALILLGHALFLAVEFLLLAFVQDATCAPRPTPWQMVRAWLGEIVVGLQVFGWRQPFRANEVPDLLPDAQDGRRGVVLVHGMVCNRGFWTPWLRVLHRQGVPCLALDLEPVFGTISEYVDRVEQAVARVASATGRPVVLVGHSMGGLAIRAWLTTHGARGRVHRVVTIGSPHRGTWLARFGRTTNGIELRPGSPWLLRLESAEAPADWRRWVCFFGHCDNVVFPASTATLPGACNRHLPGTAHVAMAFRPEVLEAVCRLAAETDDAEAQ